MKKREASLRSIFEIGDNTVYDLVVYDDKLLYMEQKLVNFDGLAEYCTSEYKADFVIADGVLRCNPLIVPAQIDFALKQELMRENAAMTGEPGSGSLFSLLARGAQEGFIIVNPQDGGKYDVAKFSTIQFSNSTMTVYVPVYGNNGLYNKVLVRYGKEDGLRVQPFIFGAKCQDMPGCVGAGELEVNGEHYYLFEPQAPGIYDNDVVFSEGIVNQACNNMSVFSSGIAAISAFIKMLTEYRETQWIGGDGDYKTPYGVYFQPSLKKIKDVNFVLRWMLDNVMKGKEADDGVKERLGASYNACYAMAISALKIIMKSGGSPERQLAAAFDLKGMLQEKLFWCGLYCYRVRVESFLYNKRLTPFDRPLLVGGNTKEYTTVKALYIY